MLSMSNGIIRGLDFVFCCKNLSNLIIALQLTIKIVESIIKSLYLWNFTNFSDPLPWLGMIKINYNCVFSSCMIRLYGLWNTSCMINNIDKIVHTRNICMLWFMSGSHTNTNFNDCRDLKLDIQIEIFVLWWLISQ